MVCGPAGNKGRPISPAGSGNEREKERVQCGAGDLEGVVIPLWPGSVALPWREF